MNLPPRFAILLFAALSALAAPHAVLAQAVPPPPQLPPNATPPAETDPWPRDLAVAGVTYVVYQPQVVSWTGNQLDYRVAVGIRRAGANETFGVVSGSARTEVDRAARMVDLEDFGALELKFPLLPDNGRAYTAGIKQAVTSALSSISLNRVEASLGASGALKPPAVQVDNTPPNIIVSYGPALLVPVDGAPVVKQIPDSRFERVINTQALIARTRFGDTWYLHVYDGWLSSQAVDGPWSRASRVPFGLNDTAQQLAKRGTVDLLTGGPNAVPKPSLANGVPAIYVTQTASELIVFKGPANFVPVTGTSLLWGSNTAADVFIDTASSNYYVLASGRWYTGPSMSGPWRFVAPDALPADFARIPKDQPPGVVLASVAGTPQAAEAVIANSIPQTATVARVNGPSFVPSFDGAPQYAPVPGTSLRYVVNSRIPIIETGPDAFYAVSAGVWFTAGELTGPWIIATSVPAAVYTIPASSPLHYVTYVHVYGYTPTVVYVGYTPGYLGTVVAPGGVVVYGTGYTYTPWIGSVWYPTPVTWGIAAAPVYNPAVGFAFGFGMGLATAAIATPYWGGAYYHAGYYGYPCCGSASANVYRNWGTGVSSGTRTWYNNGGTVGTTASGSYANYRGTSGNYWGQRSYNPYTGQSQGSYGRSFTTASGTTGNVARGASYNAQTGQRNYASSASATGAGGSSASRSVQDTAGPQGYSRSASTTTYNAKTGQTNTWSNGHPSDNNHYGDSDGNVYRNSGSGWQQHTSDGWQSASGSTSWADREQQARASGDSQDRSFDSGSGGWDRSGSGSDSWGSRFGGSGGDSWGSRFGGGDHSWGGGGGWGSRFSSSGFGDRFGGGGFRGGGFRR